MCSQVTRRCVSNKIKYWRFFFKYYFKCFRIPAIKFWRNVLIKFVDYKYIPWCDENSVPWNCHLMSILTSSHEKTTNCLASFFAAENTSPINQACWRFTVHLFVVDWNVVRRFGVHFTVTRSTKLNVSEENSRECLLTNSILIAILINGSRLLNCIHYKQDGWKRMK